MGEIEREGRVNAVQEKGFKAALSEAIIAGSVQSDLPLYREQAGEWFTHAGRYADIARLCLEAGDLAGATHATRRLIAYTKQASGVVREMNDAADIEREGAK